MKQSKSVFIDNKETICNIFLRKENSNIEHTKNNKNPLRVSVFFPWPPSWLKLLELQRRQEGLGLPLAVQILVWPVQGERSQDLGAREFLDHSKCSQVTSS